MKLRWINVLHFVYSDFFFMEFSLTDKKYRHTWSLQNTIETRTRKSIKTFDLKVGFLIKCAMIENCYKQHNYMKKQTSLQSFWKTLKFLMSCQTVMKKQSVIRDRMWSDYFSNFLTPKAARLATYRNGWPGNNRATDDYGFEQQKCMHLWKSVQEPTRP